MDKRKKFVFRIIEKNRKIASEVIEALSRAEAWQKLLTTHTMYEASSIEIIAVKAA